VGAIGGDTVRNFDREFRFDEWINSGVHLRGDPTDANARVSGSCSFPIRVTKPNEHYCSQPACRQASRQPVRALAVQGQAGDDDVSAEPTKSAGSNSGARVTRAGRRSESTLPVSYQPTAEVNSFNSMHFGN